MKLPSEAGTIFDRFCSLLAVVAAVIVVFMVILINADVFMRYVLRAPQPYVQDLTEFSILYITFLGTTWLLKKEGHVKMDMVLNYLNPRNQSMLNTITSFVCAIICLIVGWYGTLFVWDLFRNGIHLASVLEPPKWLILVIIPVGCFLLFIQFLVRAHGYLGSWRALSNK